jgi:hypothetical protein
MGFELWSAGKKVADVSDFQIAKGMVITQLVTFLGSEPQEGEVDRKPDTCRFSVPLATNVSPGSQVEVRGANGTATHNVLVTQVQVNSQTGRTIIGYIKSSGP